MVKNGSNLVWIQIDVDVKEQIWKKKYEIGKWTKNLRMILFCQSLEPSKIMKTNSIDKN